MRGLTLLLLLHAFCLAALAQGMPEPRLVRLINRNINRAWLEVESDSFDE